MIPMHQDTPSRRLGRRTVRLLLLAACTVLAQPGPSRAACPGTGPQADAAALVQAAMDRLNAQPPDTDGAAACLEAAFATGDPGAAVARGQLALTGPATDPTLAARWFFLAARAGSPQGYLAAGLALARGAGAPADPAWAYWHLGRALALPGLSPDEAREARDAAVRAAAALTPAERATLDANLSGPPLP